jgi:hypothetical protein
MNLNKVAIKPKVNGKRQPFNRVLNDSVIPMACHTGNLKVLFGLLWKISPFCHLESLS